MDRITLDGLFDDTDGLYTITMLKRQPKDFSLGEMRREIARGEQLSPLYQLAAWIVPQLEISNEGVSYYASLVSYYSIFRLRQLDVWIVYLYLLCFIVHRYQRLNDNLLSCFIHLVKQFGDEAKSVAKQQVYEQRLRSNQDMPKAGAVLKLFTTDHDPDTAFRTVQAKAFAILERQRLDRLADYIASEASFDETAFQWEHIDTMARRFKQHLRPLIRAVPFAALRDTAPILEAVQLLKTTCESNRSLRQIDVADIPTRCIPARDKRYLYDRDQAGHKQLIPDRYEFLVYRLLRKGVSRDTGKNRQQRFSRAL